MAEFIYHRSEAENPGGDVPQEVVDYMVRHSNRCLTEENSAAERLGGYTVLLGGLPDAVAEITRRAERLRRPGQSFAQLMGKHAFDRAVRICHGWSGLWWLRGAFSVLVVAPVFAHWFLPGWYEEVEAVHADTTVTDTGNMIWLAVYHDEDGDFSVRAHRRMAGALREACGDARSQLLEYEDGECLSREGERKLAFLCSEIEARAGISGPDGMVEIRLASWISVRTTKLNEE
jgi:hypothetical protein